jgi:hypothetical protein
MKQRLSRLVFFSGIFTVAAISCKKEKDTPAETIATRIIGNWREIYSAADINANGQADSNERSSSNYYHILSLYDNGNVHDTLYMNGVASSIDATYSISGDYLSIHFPDIAPKRILQLDASALVLADTTQVPTVITAFNKQQ